MTKINKLSDYSGEDNFTSVFLKINEVIDWINKHDTSGRHIIPSDKEEECTCSGDKQYWKENKFYCVVCDKPIKPKQSTSLKENAAGIIYEYLRASGIIFNTIDSKEIADKVLKLIQSHIVKEVNRYDKEVRGGIGRTDMDDIIKIINNICHTQQD